MNGNQAPNNESSIVDRLLAGDTEAETEYRRTLLADLELDSAFVDRWLSADNIAKLNEARSMGIHPDSILTLCQLCADAKWTKNATLTATEAKEAVRELRKMKRVLRQLLPRTVFPMSQLTRDQSVSPLVLASPTAPRFSFLGRFPLLGPESMKQLWDVVGTNQENGLLGDLADAIEGIIPSLKVTKPAHRSQHQGKQMFAMMWDRLARKTVLRPCYELGAWFCAVTFALSHNDFDSTAFRMSVKRSRS